MRIRGSHRRAQGSVWNLGSRGEMVFAGTMCCRWRGRREARTSGASPVLVSRPWLELPRFPGLSTCLSPLHWTPCVVFFLSFISSKTEDWGYLNEDGELGLAYQGLKQVARSNTCLSSCVFSVRPACCVYSCFSWTGCKGMGHNSRGTGGGPSGCRQALLSRLCG